MCCENHKKIIKVQEDTGGRADTYIADKLNNITRSYVKTLIEKQLVKLNGKIIKKSGESIKTGDIIEIDMPPIETISAIPENIPLDIIYEDDDIIVINKAQGMVTHPATGSPNGTLVNALMYRTNTLSTINGVIRPGIVHRLDKNTSGLLVVAKNDTAHKKLANQIASKKARRIYVALVDGNIKNDGGIIDEKIGRSAKDRKLMAVTESGRPAITHYKVLERFGLYSLVEFELKTGRTHQIRAHAKHIHHPVVGDTAYGGSNKFKLDGQLLHAKRLIFMHPTTGELMDFAAPLPEYFEIVIQRLKKADS